MQTSVLDSSVLVLNKHYLAIRVVNVKRAVSLLFRDLAHVINVEDGRYSTYDFQSWAEVSLLKKEFEPQTSDWLRTVRFDLAVPRVIRLLFYDRLPRQQVKFNRRNIFARDRNHCQYCGKKFSSCDLSLDHVVPRSRGGRSTWENTVCCCLDCNVKKGGRVPKEARIRLITAPRKPKRSPVIALKLSNQRYASWKEFLDHAYWSVELK